jgi:uncharacterized protein YbaP (TraB family)
MVRRAPQCVVSICAVLCFASGAVPSAIAQRAFVIREKPYLANRLPLVPPRDAAVAPSTTKHCVWRVMNVSVQFYLVGTIHSLRPQDYPLPGAYLNALKNSKRLLFEYNPLERLAYTKKFRAAGRYPPGRDIASEIRPETLAFLMQNSKTFHLPPNELRTYKPWALAYRLWSLRGYAAATGIYSVDDYFSSQAQRMGKEIAGLETVDEHVEFWQNALQLEGERLLLNTLQHRDWLKERFADTRAAWKRGDIAALSETNESLHKANPSVAQKLFDRRNMKWLARIEAEMKTGKPTAIVAGAGHFAGSNSVLELLQKRGYKIEQL